MINYEYFYDIARVIRKVDPNLEYKDFTIRKCDCDAALIHRLSHCSSIKADVFVRKEAMTVNVEEGEECYRVSYNPTDVHKVEQISMEVFKKKFSRDDPILVMTIIDFYQNNKDAILYEEQHGSRIHYGVKVGDDRVYEGAMKL